jgi:hypothetical protein
VRWAQVRFQARVQTRTDGRPGVFGARLPVVRTRPLIVLAAGALLLAGCTGSQDDGKPWPLTGLPGYPGAGVDQVVTVKVDDTGSGRPQAGLGSADLVVQQMVEGGVTRLAVMFHSEHPEVAGPVRSMRETDIGLVLPTGGTLAASGGAPDTVEALAAAGVPTAEEGAPGFQRDPGRAAPYDLMLDVGSLAESLGASPPSQAYLPFGELTEEVLAQAGGEPAGAIDLTWPGASARFEADQAGEWTRADVADPEGASFTTVIALRVPVAYRGGVDSSGSPIPTMITEGSGSGLVATQGLAVPVTWTKNASSSAWSLSYESAETGGTESFPVPPGRTWLALVPEDDGGVSVSAPTG